MITAGPSNRRQSTPWRRRRPESNRPRASTAEWPTASGTRHRGMNTTGVCADIRKEAPPQRGFFLPPARVGNIGHAGILRLTRRVWLRVGGQPYEIFKHPGDQQLPARVLRRRRTGEQCKQVARLLCCVRPSQSWSREKLLFQLLLPGAQLLLIGL